MTHVCDPCLRNVAYHNILYSQTNFKKFKTLYDLETYGDIGVLFLHMLQVLTNINKS